MDHEASGTAAADNMAAAHLSPSLLLAATTQATVDLQAFEAWSGRLNMARTSLHFCQPKERELASVQHSGDYH